MLVEFRNFLQSPEISKVEIKEDEGEITFQYKGYAFLFVCSEEDSSYIRLILPKIATEENLKDGIEILPIINEYNKKYKAIKMCLFGEYIWLSMEQFVYSKENISDFFKRIVNILIYVIEEFKQECLK